MTTENFNCGTLDLLYSPEDYKRVNDYFRVQKSMMSLMGLQPQKLQEKLPKCVQGFGALLAKFYSCFVMANSFIFALLYYKTAYDHVAIGDLGEMSDALTNGLIYTVSCFSTTYFLWNLQLVSDYMNNINHEYRHHSMAGLTFVSYYAPYRRVQSFAVIWSSLCFFGVTTWSVAPILLGTRTLPLKCWYPYDAMAPVAYELNYFMQFFGQVNVGTTFSLVSGLFLTFVVLLLSQFDVLYCSLKNLDVHAQLLCGKDLKTLRIIQSKMPFRQNDELNQLMLLEEHKTDLNVYSAFYAKRQREVEILVPQAALHESLKECIHMHRFLLKACSQLESLYHPTNLLISLQCIIQLCLLVFAVVDGERSTIRTFSQIQYFCLTLTNLVIYTYSAELLRQHSVRSGEAFWRSQWTPFNVHSIRRDIMIFLTNSNRVVQLTAGKLYNMDVNHLRKALIQVFSLFTLLRKLADKKNI